MNKMIPPKLSPTANVFFIILAISSITYTLFNRPFIDFLKFSLYIDIALISFSAIILFSAIKKFKSIKGLGEKNHLTSLIILLSLLGPIYYSIGVLLSDMPNFKKIAELPRNLIIPITVFAILLSGSLLFYFRLKYRCIYGITEAATGIIIAINKLVPQNVEDFTKSSFYLAVLTASIYLVVRGFDNIHQGLTKEPLDPISVKINALVNIK